LLERYQADLDTHLPTGRWFNAFALRSGKTKAIVALAIKLTRIAWVIVTTNDEFKANCALKSA